MIKNAIRIALASLAISATAVTVPLVTTLANKKTYTVDVSEFNNVIVVDGAPVLSSLSIVENRGRKSKVISITDDMIVSCDDTTTVGEKQLVLKYNNQLFTVNFTVKCKVDFIADFKIVNTQYVMDLEEIEFPQAPQKDGCQFVKWHSDNVEVGTNLVYNAVYTVSSNVMPKLSEEYSSTYGKTLESIILPSNSNGSWKFVKDVATPVGNAGKNTFEVEFVPTNSSLIKPAKDVVTINVEKQKVAINVINDTFTFDGTEKAPIYSTKLSDLKVDCTVNNGPAINASEYTYKLEINEQNYKGTYYGTLKIEKVYAKILVEDLNMDYTTAIPESFDYVVLDKDGNELSEQLVGLMGVKTSIPTITDADKVYDISANVSDNTNFNVEVEKGNLTFNKVEWELDENIKILKDDSKQIVYGSTLSSLEFAEFVHGKWYWNEPDFKVLTTGNVTVKATFVPNNNNYLQVTRNLTLTIIKKELKIVSKISNNTYTYDAQPHTISYELVDVESVDDKNSISVEGVITKTDANENGYITKLVVNDDRYFGELDATLKIMKASNSDFENALVSKEVVYKEGLILDNVKLGSGYTWLNPETKLNQVGKQSFIVNYVPTDTKNYNIEQQLVEIEVLSADAVLNVKNCENELIIYTYSANGYDFVERVSANHNEAEIGFVYMLNNEPVNKLDCVGTYTVTISLPQTEHYNAASKTITIVINQVENTQNIATEVTATYGDLLSKYLPASNTYGSWSWQTTETTVGNATTNSTRIFVAVYSPYEDYKQNYASRTVSVEFTVNKQEVLVPTIANKVFNASLQKATEYEIDYNQTLYTIVKNDGGTNVGEYNVVLSLNYENNYVWSGNYASLTKITLTYKIISSEQNDWTVEPTISNNWIYGQKATANASSLYGEYKIMFKPYGAEDTNYVEFDVEESDTYSVGKYTAIFVVENEDVANFNELRSKEFDFEIRYREIIKPSVANSGVTYTGSELTSQIVESADYTITNNKHTNAGTYKVTLTLTNDNYIWKGDNERVATLELDFVINKVENTQNIATEVTATYGELLNKYLPASNTYGSWSWQTTETTVGNATTNNTRTFVAVYSPYEDYKQNYASRTVSVEFTVNKQEVLVPTIANKVFNASLQKATEYEIDYNQTLYTIVKNDGGTNVGEYNVVLSLNYENNYVWSGNYASLTKITLTYKIISSEQNDWTVEPTISNNWIYGQKATANASSLYGEYKIMFKPYGAEDTNYAEFDVEKSDTYNVGKYTAIFVVENEDADNFNELRTDEISFEIKYYEVDVPEVKNSGVTYNAQEQTADITKGDNYTILNNKYTNAGTHKVTLTLTNDNYIWKGDSVRVATKQLDFVINKVENTQNVATEITATYGDLLSKYLPISNTYGSWSWQTTETTVGNATTIAEPTRTFVAVYIPYEDCKQNYASRTVSVEFAVNQKDVIIPTIAKVTYNGNSQSPLNNEIDRNSEIYEVSQDINESQVGKYTVILKLKDSNNYYWNTSNLSENVGYLSEDISYVNLYYTIGSATNTWKTAPTLSSKWDYGTLATANAKAEFGGYTIKFKKAGADDNSTYVNFDITKSNTYAMGNYVAIFVVNESRSSYNSNLLNYNGLTSNEIPFEIKQLEIAKPTVTNLTHVYNGGSNSATIETSSYYSITGNSRINVGSQTVTISLNNENCKWKNGGRENLTYTLTVDPATNTWTSTPQNITTTYGGSYTPLAIAELGTTTVTYSNDGGATYTSTKPSNAGDYKIKYTVPANVVDGVTNYAEINAVVDLTIAKANITLGGYNLTDKPYYENSAVATLNSKLTATGVNGVNLKNAGSFTIDGSLVLKTTNPTTSQTYENISYNVTFTPNAATLANYNAPSAVSGSIYLNRVAYIGSTYYGSIENALSEVENATSATTVMVVPNASGDVTIASNVTIGSKVTLALPYLSAADNKTHVVNSNFEAYLCNQSDDQVVNNNVDVENIPTDFDYMKLTNKVVVLRGVTVTNKGVLKIAGEVSCGSTNTGVCGNTARNFAEIELQDGVTLSDGTNIEGAKIVSENGSSIFVFGFIDEDLTSTNRSLPGSVTVNDGARLDIPFVVNDVGGGTYMTACYVGVFIGLKITPFKQFELRNVVTNMTINAGATVMGHANVFGNSVVNYAEVKLIGPDSGYLINLTSGAKLECKYESLDRLSLSATQQINNIWWYGTNHLTFKGGATANKLSLKLLDQNVDTSTVPFPISWRQNITLANLDGKTGAQYSMYNGYKMLPGAVFKVNAGVTLNITNLNIYDAGKFNDNPDKGYPVVPCRYGYYRDGYTSMNLSAAYFELNGTMVASGGVGGKVYSKTNGASIKVAKNQFKSYEVDKYSSGIISSRYTIDTKLTLVHSDGSTKSGSKNTTYTYNGSTWS